MALKGWDGFDNYNSVIDANARAPNFIQYQFPQNGENFIFRPGQYGYGAAFQRAGFADGGFGATFRDFNSTAFIGCDITVAGDSPGGYIRTVVAFFDQRQPSGQWTFAFNFDKTISVYRGGLGLLNTPTVGVLLYTSPPLNFEFDTFFFLEVGFHIDTVNGWLIIRINAEEVVVLNNVNIQTSSFNTFDAMSICFEGFNIFVSALVDNLYYCDDTIGPGDFPCNWFLATPNFIPRVLTQFPKTEVSVQFTPQPSSHLNRENVSEDAMDSDTTYNFSNTVGQRDLFRFDGLPNMQLDLIYGVQIISAARKTDAGFRAINNVLISCQSVATGSTESLGITRSLPDTLYAYFVDLWFVDPNTNKSWTIFGVDSLVAGYKLAA